MPTQTTGPDVAAAMPDLRDGVGRRTVVAALTAAATFGGVGAALVSYRDEAAAATTTGHTGHTGRVSRVRLQGRVREQRPTGHQEGRRAGRSDLIASAAPCGSCLIRLARIAKRPITGAARPVRWWHAARPSRRPDLPD